MAVAINPLHLLEQLESAGLRLRVKDGKLMGPKHKLTIAQQNLISENKPSLVALISHQCPTCNQPLRVIEKETFKYLECVDSAIHYALLMPKTSGCMFFPEGVKPMLCKECGLANDGPYKYCNRCWLKFIEEG